MRGRGSRFFSRGAEEAGHVYGHGHVYGAEL